MSSITDLSNVQGDILLGGLNKEVETFAFFTIPAGQESAFARALRNVAQQEITSTQNVLSTRRDIRDFRTNLQPGAAVSKIPTVGANISFTFNGLQKISRVVTSLDVQSLSGGSFGSGMKRSAVSGLQDPIKQNTQDLAWNDQWLNNKLDGVILVAGQTTQLVQDKLNRITQLFGPAAQVAFKINGNVRPGDQRGKEHFGYQDGISQPIVDGLPGLTKEESFVPPGQDIIDQGVILCGRPGDNQAQSRPQWMLDGSFLVFRQLKQNVQDWNDFLQQSANNLGVFKDQLGARLIGRWKSGCPINLQADFDDVNIGKDKMRNNLFEYDPRGLDKNNSFSITSGMRLVCPIGAHIRKTNPRGDQFGPNDDPRKNVNPHRILRRGIPYGPEIQQDPKAERGLLFACYQSNLDQGFDFIQRNWANNTTFRFPGAGVDAVMGQTNRTPTVGMKGLFPQDANRELQLPGINRFVVPQGGEYFFSPSISTMTGVMSNVSSSGVANGVNGHGQQPLRL